MSLIIAKQGQPHTIEKKNIYYYLKTVLEKVIHFKNTNDVLRCFPLSNNSVKKRKDEMSECV